MSNTEYCLKMAEVCSKKARTTRNDAERRYLNKEIGSTKYLWCLKESENYELQADGWTEFANSKEK